MVETRQDGVAAFLWLTTVMLPLERKKKERTLELKIFMFKNVQKTERTMHGHPEITPYNKFCSKNRPLYEFNLGKHKAYRVRLFEHDKWA